MGCAYYSEIGFVKGNYVRGRHLPHLGGRQGPASAW
jgi:hypothetical protein